MKKKLHKKKKKKHKHKHKHKHKNMNKKTQRFLAWISREIPLPLNNRRIDGSKCCNWDIAANESI